MTQNPVTALTLWKDVIVALDEQIAAVDPGVEIALSHGIENAPDIDDINALCEIADRHVADMVTKTEWKGQSLTVTFTFTKR